MLRFPFILICLFAGPPAEGQTCRPRERRWSSPVEAPRVWPTSAFSGCSTAWVFGLISSCGSSMGAIIGGMYASGYTGREIDSLARALPMADLFRTYQPRAPGSLGPHSAAGGMGAGRAEIHHSERGESKRRRSMPWSMRAMLRGNLLARGNFDSLPIPFRAVAADLADRTAVVLATGDLARAVRASFAIPLVFAPESLNGRILADGGLAANIPVAVATGPGAGRVIVSDATERPGDSLDPVLANRRWRIASSVSCSASGPIRWARTTSWYGPA